MERKAILQMVDHTLLAPGASEREILQIVDDAVTYETASVCIPPSYVKKAADYAQGRVKICTVIGFPNGYCTTAVKVFEARDALANGADEIDMVINIGWVKDRRTGELLEEIRRMKEVCGDHILKVIIETCLLTEAEKVLMCRIVTEAGADFIKTSTGFSSGGATPADVALMKAHVGPDVRVKAAGGISSFADAEQLVQCGASRLGTSRLVKIAKKEDGIQE